MTLNAAHLIGRYEVLSEIGRGSMGIVYKAHDAKINRAVAIKTILLFDLPPGEEREYRARFNEEARAAGRLSHPGIVTVFDVEPNPPDGKPYIVMEYVDGKSLNKLLDENQGKLPLGPALCLVQEVAEALHLAHSQGVIHRDIKPENILVTAEGHAKIADFGIARLDQGHMTLPGRMLGSPAYISPEQLNGENTDARSDLFSLGVVLYTLLTGHRPFQGNSTATVCFKVANRDPLPASAWNPDFPLELDELVSRAMAKNPTERFQTGLEMAHELQRFREAHEAAPQPLASIMRIIGQESAAIAKTVMAERKSDFDSLPPAAPHALTTQPTQPGRMALVAKETSRDRGPSTTARPFMPKAFVLIAAGLVLVGGFTLWSKQKHPPEKERVLSAANASPASPPAETSTQPSAGQEPTADQNVTRQPAPRLAARPANVAVKTVSRAISPHVATASKAVAHADAVSLLANAEASNSPDSVTVRMIHLSDLHVTIDHSFQEADASISVDNRVAYSEELHGEKKRRALLFTHTQGSQSHTITIAPGKHDIVVRVKSPADGYDVTQTLSQSFSPGSNQTLLVKCDKHKKRLELSIR